MKIITFKIANESYGIDILNIIEIIIPTTITHMVSQPTHVLGIINLRNKIIPIIDLRIVFNKSLDMTSKTRIIITSGSNQLVGFVVDEVEDVKALDEDQFDTVPIIDAEVVEKLYKAEDKLISILDIEKLVSYKG